MHIEPALQFVTEPDAERLEQELRQLKRTMRDLVALAIIPAAWVGRGPRHIAQGLLELLITTLRLDAAYVCLDSVAGEPGCDFVQCQEWPQFEQWVRNNHASLRSLRKIDRVSPPSLIYSNESHSVLKIEVVPIGMQTAMGMVAVASTRPDFPSEPEKLLLSVAANQAATALHAACMSADRAAISKELVHSEEKFRSLSACSPVGIFLTDTRPHCTYTNPRCQAICGFSSEQALGDGWGRFVHPDDRERVLEEWMQSARNGGEFDREFRWANPVSGTRWTRVRSAPLYNDQHELVGHVGTVEDITDHKASEQALREREEQVRLSEQRLRAALAASDTGTFRWDSGSGRFLDFGVNLGRLLSLGPEEKITNTGEFLARVHPDDLPGFTSMLERCAREGADLETELRVILPGGEIRWLYARGKMEQLAGESAYLVGACTDITERKLVQAALIESEKLASAGRLAATVAHEINNPLEAVTNYIYLARNNRELPDKVRKHLTLADQELARVTHIAQQTLGFYRDNSQPVLVSVEDAVNDVLTIYERKMKYKSLSVERQIRGPLQFETLQGELKQALSNLIANAIDACSKEGRILVRARLEKRWQGQPATGIRITIADNGSGMPPDVRRKVFTPFFTTKKDVGTGLGLWVTKNIVEKQRGSVCLRSREGSGTVIRIFLPLEQSRPKRLVN